MNIGPHEQIERAKTINGTSDVSQYHGLIFLMRLITLKGVYRKEHLVTNPFLRQQLVYRGIQKLCPYMLSAQATLYKAPEILV